MHRRIHPHLRLGIEPVGPEILRAVVDGILHSFVQKHSSRRVQVCPENVNVVGRLSTSEQDCIDSATNRGHRQLGSFLVDITCHQAQGILNRRSINVP